eukprot:5793221-Alexandrium_andersonii.AAC.1
MSLQILRTHDARESQTQCTPWYATPQQRSTAKRKCHRKDRCSGRGKVMTMVNMADSDIFDEGAQGTVLRCTARFHVADPTKVGETQPSPTTCE